MKSPVIHSLLLAMVILNAIEATAADPQTPIRRQDFKVGDRPAFIIAPPKERAGPTPWILYAPTLGRGLPGKAEHWMFRQFLDAGMAIAGVDVGESYGSPAGRATYNALHKHLTTKRGFATKACLPARSRGGLIDLGRPSSVDGTMNRRRQAAQHDHAHAHRHGGPSRASVVR